MSAFFTLVENADTLENARKMRKNARIRTLSKTVAWPSIAVHNFKFKQ